jgi:S-adenosylmethionine hydrolase
MVRKNLIVLLTDFGLSDNYVGVMKGVIKKINPSADIIDLSNEILPQSIRQAAFCLFTSYKYFPEKTVFTCVIDPGVGSNRKILLVKTENYYFIVPDNGIISWVIEKEKIEKIIWIQNKKYFLDNISNTFHGRDIFAPVTGWLTKGININSFGKEINNIVKIPFPKPKIDKNKILCEIIYIDRFGNLITNIENSLFNSIYEKSNLRKIVFSEKKVELKKSYDSVEMNQPLVINGSHDYIEISVRGKSAKEYFNCKIGQKIPIYIY